MFSLGRGLNIFNLMCVLATAHRAHGLFETFCFDASELSLAVTSNYDYTVSDYAEKLLYMWITEIKRTYN